MSDKPPDAWYLAPIFMGIIGGAIMWYVLKDEDHPDSPKMVRKGWVIGIVFTLLWFAWIIPFVFMGSMMGSWGEQGMMGSWMEQGMMGSWMEQGMMGSWMEKRMMGSMMEDPVFRQQMMEQMLQNQEFMQELRQNSQFMQQINP